MYILEKCCNYNVKVLTILYEEMGIDNLKLSQIVNDIEHDYLTIHCKGDEIYYSYYDGTRELAIKERTCKIIYPEEIEEIGIY